MHTYCRGQRSMLGVFLNISPSWLLRQGLSLDLETTSLVSLAGQWALGILLSPSPYCWDYSCTVASSFFFFSFMQDLGIELKPSCLHSKHFLHWDLSTVYTYSWRICHASLGQALIVFLGGTHNFSVTAWQLRQQRNAHSLDKPETSGRRLSWRSLLCLCTTALYGHLVCTPHDLSCYKPMRFETSQDRVQKNILTMFEYY